MLTMATRSMFFLFFGKRHKIVEIFALLTTELSSYPRANGAKRRYIGEGY